MSLRDRRFERSVRRRVRRAIQTSPAQRREYQRTRSRRYDTPQSVLRGLASALLAISLAKLGERNATLDAMLGLVAIWCAGFAAHYANRLRFHLYGAPPILVLALQPIGDHAIFVHQWRTFVRTCLWLLVDLAAALAVVCAFAEASLVQWLTAIPCALALWMSAVSIATLFVRLRPGANFSALSSALFLLILTTVMAGFYLPDTTARLLDGASGPFYTIPPFGWICYVIREAVLGTSLLPLLLLLPVALLAPALHHARKRLGTNYKLFAADDSDDSGEDDTEPALTLPESADAGMPSSARTAIDPEQARWVAEAWRRPASPWTQPQVLERWLNRFLSTRERDLAEFLTAGHTDWTANLRRASILVAAALMAALTLGPSGLWLSYLGLYFAATNAIPLLGTPCVGLSMVQMAGTSFPAYAGLPIGFREMSRFLLKVGFVRLLAFAPIALVAGAVIGHLNSHGWSAGLLFGAKIVALLLCWQPIVVALQFSVGTNDTRGPLGRSLKLFAIFGPLILGLLGATAGTLFAPLPVSLASLAATAALSWAAFRLYARFYNRNAFDLMHGQAQ